MITVPAPAKVNLFLHVTGRRSDGYHDLESLVALVDLADSIALTSRDDGEVAAAHDIAGIARDDDLSLRAARALKSAAGVRDGVTIALTKRIPLGAGLGGGSSDAASVLLALNRLWKLDLARAQLADIALTLGADVPFFVRGENAIARGIGEALTPVTLPTSWLVLVHPRAHVETRDIFTARELTRNAPSAKIDVFSEGYGRNDLAAVTREKFPAVREALDALDGARMTGSGSAVFAAFATEQQAARALIKLPRTTQGRLVRTLVGHPLAAFAR